MIRLEIAREPSEHVPGARAVAPPDLITISARDIDARRGFSLEMPVPIWRGWLANLGRQVSRDFIPGLVAMDCAVASLTLTHPPPEPPLPTKKRLLR